jgi:hypothetical protein
MDPYEAYLDLNEKGVASPYYDQIVQELQGIEPGRQPTEDDVMQYALQKFEEESTPQQEQVPQQAGPGGPQGFVENIIPALQWLKKVLTNPNKNPFPRASNWGGAGEQFGRSVERMKLRDE